MELTNSQRRVPFFDSQQPLGPVNCPDPGTETIAHKNDVRQRHVLLSAPRRVTLDGGFGVFRSFLFQVQGYDLQDFLIRPQPNLSASRVATGLFDETVPRHVRKVDQRVRQSLSVLSCPIVVDVVRDVGAALLHAFTESMAYRLLA